MSVPYLLGSAATFTRDNGLTHRLCRTSSSIRFDLNLAESNLRLQPQRGGLLVTELQSNGANYHAAHDYREGKSSLAQAPYDCTDTTPS
jgi:hypothetical protein